MIKTYKCTGCGAPVEYNGSEGALVCEYCGTRMSVDEMKKSGEAYDEEVEVESDASTTSKDVDGYKCSSCGAELITDANTTATVCSFCGSSAIIKSRMAGATMPAKIIPFTMTREQAADNFKSWCKKGIFTPSQFKKTSFAESVTGIYVPFWLYNYDASCHMDAHATKTRHHREGEYEVTDTDHFEVARDTEASFELIPADASEKMPDEMMDLLEPFDYGRMVDFDLPYMSGFMSEKYSYDSDRMAARAEKRVRSYIYSETKNTITGYSSVNVVNSRIRMKRKSAVYALLPVWMITYRYKGENHMLAINGQTGKQVGSLPFSKAKIGGWFAGIFAVAATVLIAIGQMG